MQLLFNNTHKQQIGRFMHAQLLKLFLTLFLSQKVHILLALMINLILVHEYPTGAMVPFHSIAYILS